MSIDFKQASCDAARNRLDDYLSGEASPGSRAVVERHLESCAECRRELESRRLGRDRLAAAARAEPVPDGLAERVRMQLDGEPAGAPRRRLLLAAAVAAAVVTTGGWASSLQLTGIAPHEFLMAEIEIRRLTERVSHIAGVGLGDHVHCAVYRRYPERHLTFKQAASELSPADEPSVRALEQAAEDDLDLRLAHRCTYRGREFLHFALTDETGRLASVLFTAKQEGDEITGEFEAAEVERYRIVTFGDGDRWAFVVSDLDRQTNRDLARRLRESLLSADSPVGAA